MKKIHLVCNAHIDPVWLWDLEEGAAEAISTFRTAADFCEEYEGFVFNHNEVILYKWVEEYEPKLFKRIQKLVEQGRWHIMGGWYLQPDCNMPSGESFVRQILLGRTYFKEKFGVEPTTAINFDPFGHTRGLVQILKKSGYDSYIFCRPGEEDCSLPKEDFLWIGYDGSEIIGHRAYGHYNSLYGQADKKVANRMRDFPDKEISLVLWGIGNHGGGPSRIDIEKLAELMKKTDEFYIMNSTVKDYFDDLKAIGTEFPKFDKDLNPWGVGCYTSQVRIKQKHRLLENETFMVEKMLSAAAIQGYLRYPREDMQEIQCDLALVQFHDILPGSSIQPVEERGLRIMDRALETATRLKARAFFALAQGQPKAAEGEIPILVYNPHPYKVKGIFECEFQLADQNWKDEFSFPVVHQNGVKLPCQVEKEMSNLNLDWRKHMVFTAELEPSQMNRFDCRIEILPEKPKPITREENGYIIFDTEELHVVINCETGLVDEYCANEVSYLKKNAFKPLVIKDNEDPWGMTVKSFTKVEGAFRLMDKSRGTSFSGIKKSIIDSVRVIEDGEVRTIVEAVFEYKDSFVCQTYKLPKKGTEIEVQVRVHWNEKDKMLKLSIPTVFDDSKYIGQVAYGKDNLPLKHMEAVAQKWVGVYSEKDSIMLSCINDGVYGSSCDQGEIRMSLMRSPAYSAHPINDRDVLPQDRYIPRIDQGERLFTFCRCSVN